MNTDVSPANRPTRPCKKLSDALLTECPYCGAQALKQQLTASAFRLSGSGWYETDFKTGDKKKNLTVERFLSKRLE